MQHLSSDAPSILPEILQRVAALPVVFPHDHEAIRPSQIYVAPPDCHLLVESEKVRVVRGPKENRHRPAIDPLFRSAAWTFGPRVVGVVLTGYLDDGTAGLWAIKSCGGVTVVQDPADALHYDMPANAARVIEVDYTLPVVQIAPLLVRLAQESFDANGLPEPPSHINTEIGFAKMERDISDMNKIGTLSVFTCPTCHGALWEMHTDVLRYRCHTGHAFSKDSLMNEQTTAIEEAIYAALRAVEEKALALRSLSARHAGRSERLEQAYLAKADTLDGTADVLRSLLAGESAMPARDAAQ